MSTNTTELESFRRELNRLSLGTYLLPGWDVHRVVKALAAHDAEQAALRELECPPDPETVERELAAQAVPAGWRIQRNANGSIGLFAPPPKDGESRRTSECFTGRLGNDKEEIVFKLLDHMLEAAPAPEAQAGDGGLKRFLALAEAAGIKSINDLPGLIPALQATEAQAAGQDERAAFEAWAKENRHGRISGEDEWDMDYPLGRCLWRAWQARAALAQRQPLTEWQPIETAPKDGTLLLLWEQYESEPFIGSWYAFRSEWEASRTYYDTDGNECVVDRVYSHGVTHWMPLPAAPVATTGEQQHG